MNIFVLDPNPQIAASYHCDKHINKMAVEACQMLTAAVYYLNGIVTTKQRKSISKEKIQSIWSTYPISKATLEKYGDGGPGLAFINHPCTIWVRESSANFLWLIELGLEICNQFEKVYRNEEQQLDLPNIKEHNCKAQLYWLQNWLNQNKEKFPSSELTSFAQAMPDRYKHKDAVIAYRNYYLGEKDFATWTNRPRPDWYRRSNNTFESSYENLQGGISG